MSIKIGKKIDDVFHVTVSENADTQHEITVSDANHTKFTNWKLSKEWLVNFFFKFLLVRESNASFFRTFEISSIYQYFPKFED